MRILLLFLLLVAGSTCAQDCNLNNVPDGEELGVLQGQPQLLGGLNSLPDVIHHYDLDHDGDLDMLPGMTTTSLDEDLFFYRNDGLEYTPTLLENGWSSEYNDWKIHWCGDFFGDGGMFALITRSTSPWDDSSPASSSFYLEQIDGPARIWLSYDDYYQDAVVGDVDVDGDLDIVVSRSSSSGIGTFLQTDNGTLQPSGKFHLDFLGGRLLDWDLDGDQDFVCIQAESSSIHSLVLFEKAATLVRHVLFTAPGTLLDRVEVFFEPGDAFPDLATAVISTGEPVVIHNSGGSPTPELLTGTGSSLNGIHVRELDGDGCPELLGTRNDNVLAVWSCAQGPPLTVAIPGLAGCRLLDVIHDTSMPGWQLLGREGGSFSRLELRYGDTNGNGIPDGCDMADSVLADCNGNDLADAWELATGFLPDCNNDQIPDLCQPELDGNSDGLPDVCQDCNGNGLPDPEEGLSDCNGDGIPDICLLDIEDCNGNGIPDHCEELPDCTEDGIPDMCQPELLDCNMDGMPDDCQLGHVRRILAGSWPTGARFQADLDQDGVTDLLTTTAWYRWIGDAWVLQASLPGVCLGVGDVNGDTVPDPVVQTGGVLRWLDPADGWTSHQVATVETLLALRLRDMNGDGRLDFVCRTANNWAVYYNFSDGILAYVSPPLRTSGWPGLEVGDTNNDGVPEVITASRAIWQFPEIGYSSIYYQQTPLSYEESLHLSYFEAAGNSTYTLSAVFADTNGDGMEELCTRDTEYTEYMSGEDRATHLRIGGSSYRRSGLYPSPILALDLDGDGCDEVLTGDLNFADRTMLWDHGILTDLGSSLLGTTAVVLDGNLNGKPEFRANNETWEVWPADANDDGTLDDCQIQQGLLEDCNGNGTWDRIEIGQGFTPDRNGNGIPDSCETLVDCDANNIPDDLEVQAGMESRNYTFDLAPGQFEDAFAYDGVEGDFDGDGDREVVALDMDDVGIGSIGVLEVVEGQPVFTRDPDETQDLEGARLFPWHRSGNRADGFILFRQTNEGGSLFLRDSLGAADVPLPLTPGTSHRLVPVDLNGDGLPDVLQWHDGGAELHVSDGQGDYSTLPVNPAAVHNRLMRWREPGVTRDRILSLDPAGGHVLCLALVFDSLTCDTLDLGFPVDKLVPARLPGGGEGVLLGSSTTGHAYGLSAPLDPANPRIIDLGSTPGGDYSLYLGADFDGDSVPDPVYRSASGFQVQYSRGPHTETWQHPEGISIAAGVVTEFRRVGRPELLLLGSNVIEVEPFGNIPHLFLQTVSRVIQDHDANGELDACQLVGQTEHDCDQDGIFDEFRIATGFAEDCNGNGVPDPCDIVTRQSRDLDGNGVPDECDPPSTCLQLAITRSGPGVLLQWTSREGCPPLQGPFRLLVSESPVFPENSTVLYEGPDTSYFDPFSAGNNRKRFYRVVFPD